MANTKVSALTAVTSLTGAETIYVIQGGVSKKALLSEVLLASGNYFNLANYGGGPSQSASNNVAAFVAANAAALSFGGGTLVGPPGNYALNDTVRLGSPTSAQTVNMLFTGDYSTKFQFSGVPSGQCGFQLCRLQGSVLYGFEVDGATTFDGLWNIYGHFLQAAGSDQATATAIVEDLTLLANGASSTGVILTGTSKKQVINLTSSTKTVYPGLGETINGGSVNVGITLNAFSVLVFEFDAGDWTTSTDTDDYVLHGTKSFGTTLAHVLANGCRNGLHLGSFIGGIAASEISLDSYKGTACGVGSTTGGLKIEDYNTLNVVAHQLGLDHCTCGLITYNTGTHITVKGGSWGQNDRDAYLSTGLFDFEGVRSEGSSDGIVLESTANGLANLTLTNHAYQGGSGAAVKAAHAYGISLKNCNFFGSPINLAQTGGDAGGSIVMENCGLHATSLFAVYSGQGTLAGVRYKTKGCFVTDADNNVSARIPDREGTGTSSDTLEDAIRLPIGGGCLVNPTVRTLPDAATVTWDLETKPDALVAIGGHRTITATNLSPGFRSIRIYQDSTAGWTPFWDTMFQFQGAATPKMNPRPLGEDFFLFYCTGSTLQMVCHKQFDSVVGYDTFQDSNGTPVTSHLLTVPAGSMWSANQHRAEINSDAAGYDGDGDPWIADGIIDLGLANIDLNVVQSYTADGNLNGVIFRQSTNTNYWFCGFDRNNKLGAGNTSFVLAKKVSGSWTVVDSDSASGATGGNSYDFAVRLAGNTITATMNGFGVAASVNGSDSFNNTATKHGFVSDKSFDGGSFGTTTTLFQATSTLPTLTDYDIDPAVIAGRTISVADEKFTVDKDGDLTTINDLAYTWPSTHASGQLTNDGSGNLDWIPNSSVSVSVIEGATTDTSLGAVLAPNDGDPHLVEVGGFVNITVVSVDQLQLTVTYTDEANSPQTLVLKNTAGLTDLVGTGYNFFPSVSLLAYPGTAVTVIAFISVTGGSITYNAGGFARLLA